MSALDVSLVIVSWNTREILQGCLRSIYEQTRDSTYEVIIVDNASVDGSQEMVKREFPRTTLFENEENRGFAVANNQGMGVAKGRYVLLLNSDTVVLNGAIQKVIAFADKHPEAAVVGCKVLNPDLTLQPTCFMFPSLKNLFLSATYFYKVFPRSRFFGREQMTWWNRDDVREVDVVTGCFMLVRRESIEQVGRMDERFFMYGEETDWCWRFKKTGWKRLFFPGAEIIHLGGQSSKHVKVKSLVQLRLSILQYFHKNTSWPVFMFAGTGTWLFFLSRIPLWLVAVILKPYGQNARDRLKAYVCALGRVGRAILVPKLENFRA